MSGVGRRRTKISSNLFQTKICMGNKNSQYGTLKCGVKVFHFQNAVNQWGSPCYLLLSPICCWRGLCETLPFCHRLNDQMVKLVLPTCLTVNLCKYSQTFSCILQNIG